MSISNDLGVKLDCSFYPGKTFNLQFKKVEQGNFKNHFFWFFFHKIFLENILTRYSYGDERGSTFIRGTSWDFCFQKSLEDKDEKQHEMGRWASELYSVKRLRITQAILWNSREEGISFLKFLSFCLFVHTHFIRSFFIFKSLLWDIFFNPNLIWQFAFMNI